MFKEYYSIINNRTNRRIIMQDNVTGKFATLKTINSQCVTLLKGINGKTDFLPAIYEYGKKHIIEENIQGISIGEKLAYGRISIDEINSIICNVCDAVDAVHSVGLCHMGVSPETVTETEKGYVLTDYSMTVKFGIKLDCFFNGEKMFCSPEHLGFGVVSKATDVFSVGALLKYLLDRNCSDNHKKSFGNLIQLSMAVSSSERIQSIGEFRKMFTDAVRQVQTIELQGLDGFTISKKIPDNCRERNFGNVCHQHTIFDKKSDNMTSYPDKELEKIAIHDLMSCMDSAGNLAKYLDFHKNSFIQVSAEHFFSQLIKHKRIKKADIVKKSGIERTYAYQLLRGDKKPSRDKLIQLCIGAGLSFDETQIALKHTGFLPLYPRIRRDCIIIYAIKNQSDIWETEELLFRFGEDTFNNT